MPTRTINITGSIGGVTWQGRVQLTDEGEISHEISLPAANSGTLSTRTNDTDGTLTLESGHDIETGDTIDIFWTDANGVRKCAYEATVGTVSGQSVPFTGASGDVLPTVDTEITADEQVAVDTDFDGDDASIELVHSNRDGHCQFVDASTSPATLEAVTLLANFPWIWYDGSGYTNPLSGNPVDEVRVSNADADNSATVKIGVLYDSVA